jgi:transcriptional regulator with XRE-family HTH domain
MVSSVPDRRHAAHDFRDRLAGLIAARGLSQSAFARATGIDRSTLAQLLSADAPRLPRAETLVAVARSCGVSTDWLLGLTQDHHPDGPNFGEVLRIEEQDPVPIDDRMFRWMTEAAGAKIRTVPVSFPDVLKTQAVLRHEYVHAAGDAPPHGWESIESRLLYVQRPETEIEACTSLQVLEELAAGRNAFAGLKRSDRIEQIERIRSLCHDLYPSFRLFLFDRQRSFSVPFSVFGASRAAIFLGGIYFVFTWTEHIRALVRRFDVLVREAVVQPTEIARFLDGLKPDASE